MNQDLIVHHLLWVWFQYGGGIESGGDVLLEHRCMQAGEQACEFLEDNGYAVYEGYCLRLTKKGLDVFRREFSE